MSDSKWQEASNWSSMDENNVLDQMYYGSEYRKRNRGLPYGSAADTPYINENGSGISNSEAYLRSRGRQMIPAISAEASAKLSLPRQEYLREVNERVPVGARPNLGIAATVGTPRITKTASVAAGDMGRVSSSVNATHLAPDVYAPFFLTQNMMLPRDRITTNAWNRAYYEVNPYVRNAINLHATYPISKLNIKCEDKKVEQFFLDMSDRVDLQSVVQNAALEIWKIGEVFNYAVLDESAGCWSKIYQHNPDYIQVSGSALATDQAMISLKPDPELKKIITSSNPEHIRLREQIDGRIINHVLMNEAIPLDNFNVSHLKMLNSPYDIRGTSIIVSVWKHLMWLDKILEAKLAQADGMINPLTLVKIGAPGTDGHYPRQDEIDAWRSLMEQAQYDKDFKIITHDAVNIEQKGYSGTVLDTSSDVNYIIDSILTGLMVPKSIMTQEGASYASASVALDVMRQRYNSFRTMMANWLEKKIFAPISEIQGFYKLEGGKKKLIVPTIEWNQVTLFDLDTYLGHLTTMKQNKNVSQRTLDRSLGLNRGNEITNMRQELIESAILAKEAEALQNMTLAELRSLDPEKPIVAQEKPLLPGVPPPGTPPADAGMGDLGMGGAGTPGGFDLGMPGGGGGGDLGALPDLGPAPGGPPGPGAAPTPPPPAGKP